MAYNFVKLNEVELVETSQSVPNILIEDSGEIKRMPAKSLGGGSSIVDYIAIHSSDSDGMTNVILTTLDDVAITREELLKEWNNGNTIRLQIELENTIFYTIVLALASFDNNSAVLLTGISPNDGVSNLLYNIMEEDEV